MADYFTHFSCLLEVGVDNIERALALYQTMAEELDASDGVSIGFLVEIAHSDSDALWVHDGGGWGEPEYVIAFALRCAKAFDLQGRWGFCWALTCSGPRLDGYGGGAQVLDLTARKSLAWVDCSHWLALELQGGAGAEGR